jgi:hypothetical protein
MSNENTETNKLTVILDTIGRTVLGETVSTDGDYIKLKNPVILHIVPADNNGKMSVQLLPLFFREFLADKTGDITFSYLKDKIVVTDIDALDFRLQGQYSQMFNAQNSFVSPGGNPPQSPNTGETPSVVNLFDE